MVAAIESPCCPDHVGSGHQNGACQCGAATQAGSAWHAGMAACAGLDDGCAQTATWLCSGPTGIDRDGAVSRRLMGQPALPAARTALLPARCRRKAAGASFARGPRRGPAVRPRSRDACRQDWLFRGVVRKVEQFHDRRQKSDPVQFPITVANRALIGFDIVDHVFARRRCAAAMAGQTSIPSSGFVPSREVPDSAANVGSMSTTCMRPGASPWVIRPGQLANATTRVPPS